MVPGRGEFDRDLPLWVQGIYDQRSEFTLPFGCEAMFPRPDYLQDRLLLDLDVVKANIGLGKFHAMVPKLLDNDLHGFLF